MTPPRSQSGDAARPAAQTPKSASSSPIRIKLNVTDRSKNMDENLKAVKNAASRGKRLADVLHGKENKTKNSRPKTSLNKKPKVTKVRATGKLQGQSVLMGRITKPVVEISNTGFKKPLPEPLSPRRDSNFAAAAIKSEFSSVEASPAPETPPSACSREEWRSSDTVSPTGRVPADMVRLLN
jgi:hypothetical protein